MSLQCSKNRGMVVSRQLIQRQLRAFKRLYVTFFFMLALKNLREEEEAKLTWENTSCMLLINQLGCDMY